MGGGFANNASAGGEARRGTGEQSERQEMRAGQEEPVIFLPPIAWHWQLAPEFSRAFAAQLGRRLYERTAQALAEYDPLDEMTDSTTPHYCFRISGGRITPLRI